MSGVRETFEECIEQTERMRRLADWAEFDRTTAEALFNKGDKTNG